jgi:hypothetical protein
MTCQAIPRLFDRFSIECSLSVELFPTFFISDQPPRIREEHDRVERLRLRYGTSLASVIMASGKNEV